MKSTNTQLTGSIGLAYRCSGLVRLAALTALSFATANADTASQIRIFVSALGDQDAQIREGAVDALAALKAEKEIEGVAPQIASLLKDSDPNVRYAAAKALQVLSFNSETVIDALIEALKDPSPLIRVGVVHAIGGAEAQGRRATDHLLDLLGDSDWNLQYTVIEALGSIRADPGRSLPPLLAIIQSDRSDLSQAAIECIGKLYHSATPVDRNSIVTMIIGQLESPTRGNRLRSEEALAEFAEDVKNNATIVAALIKRTKDQDETVRGNAITALLKIGKQDAIAPVLIELTKDADFKVRELAIGGLEVDETDDVIPALLESLGDKVAEVRVASLKGLQKAKTSNGVMCRAETRLANDRDSGVRHSVAETLGGCYESASAVTEALLLLSRDSVAKVRSAAITSVSRVLGGGDWQGSETISSFLRLNSDMRAKAVIRVVEAVSDPDPDVRQGAANGLLTIAPIEDKFVPNLIAGLRDASPLVQDSIASLLASFGQFASPGVSDLVRLLKSDGSIIRANSAQALGFIGEGSALKDLVKALDEESDWEEAKPIIARAVGRVAASDPTAIESLVSALRDQDEPRKAAVWALSSMGARAKEAVQQALSEAPVKDDDTSNSFLRPRSDPKGSLTKAVADLEQLQTTVDIDVTTFEGRREKISAGPNHYVILMATWCPHSKALMDLLSNRNIKRLTRGVTFSFVFRNEWPDVTNMLKEDVKSGRISQGQDVSELRTLRARAGADSLVFDPEFLKLLPGKAYILNDVRLLPEQVYFPRIFWPPTGKFEVDADKLVTTELALPSWILKNVKF